MSAKIECVIAACPRKVDREWCLCHEHFQMLSVDMRIPLIRAYDSSRDLHEQSGAFFLALGNIQSWILATFGEQRERSGRSWAQLIAYVRDRDRARAERRAEANPNRAAARSPHLRLVP